MTRSVPLLLVLAGCSVYARGGDDLRAPAGDAPDGLRRPVDDDEPFGYTVEVTVGGQLWRGELVGCDEGGVYLLLHEAGKAAAQYLGWDAFQEGKAAQYLGWDAFQEGEIDVPGSSVFGILAWGLLGTASTASHGWWAMVSAPLWALTTIVTTVAYAVTDDESFPESAPGRNPCCDLARWARFPQGVPLAVAQRYRSIRDGDPGVADGRVAACSGAAVREEPARAPERPRQSPSPSSWGF